jgi:rubredoxin
LKRETVIVIIFLKLSGVTKTKEVFMKQYVCTVCGYVYDEAQGIPEDGIAPGTKWEDIPEDWVCPLCGAGKEDFEPVEDE